jgi:hypothetical protein
VTYEQFIEEIRRLVAQGADLLEEGATAGTYEFRKWRHEAQSTVTNAENLGFSLPGKFNSSMRAYRATWTSATPKANRDEFLREMGDSLNELRFLVDQFDKFGAPKPKQPSVPEAKAPLAAPDKVTVGWLIHNVSLTGWTIIGGLALGLLSVGYAAGRYDTLRKLFADIAALFSSSPPPH